MNRKRLVVLSLVLLELALCAGMYSIVQATVATLSEITVSIGAKPNAMADALEERRLTVDGPATLTVDNSYGPVRIMAGASDEIAISAHKQVWASTPAEAQVALAALELQVTKEGNAVRLEPTSVPPATLSLTVLRPSVDITITVPATTSVTGNVLFGGIMLSGTTGDAKLIAHRGSIRVTEAGGSLALQADSGDITAEHVRGQIQMSSNRGTLRLADIRTEGELIAKTLAGDVLLQECAASSLDVQIGRGKAGVANCTAQKVQIGTGTGDLSLDSVRTDGLRLQTQRGSIRVDGASGPLWARADTGDVTITNGDQTTLDVQTLRGMISYAGSLGQGPHELQSDTGDILLSLPQEMALTLDLQTTRGLINSQFAVTMMPGGDKNSWRGTINGGGAALKAGTRNGNIVLIRMNPKEVIR